MGGGRSAGGPWDRHLHTYIAWDLNNDARSTHKSSLSERFNVMAGLPLSSACKAIAVMNSTLFC